jgi:hypothetical protein
MADNYSIIGKVFVETDSEQNGKTIGDTCASFNQEMLTHHIKTHGTDKILHSLMMMMHQIRETEVEIQNNREPDRANTTSVA